MKMRKIIAILAAVLMLCSIIPMGAISVSAAAKLDNNFDDGTVGKFKCDSVDTIVVEDGVLKWTTQGWKNLYASFSVSANADYKVTFKMKAAATTSMEVKYLNGSWGDSGIAKDTINVGADWTEYTRILNAGSNNALVLLFQSHKATDVYIDDVKIVDYVAPVDPVFPEDAIYTETFESGSLNGWTSSTSTIVSTDGLAATKADGGNFAMDFTSPNYSYTNYKLAVEPNTDYKMVFSILSATSGYPINARVRDGSGDLGYTQYTPSTSAWETHAILFNSGNNSTVNLRFQAGWQTGTYYLDNIYVVPFDMSTLADDGHILNGGFETGDAIGWSAGANTEVIADPTGAGQGYVIKTFETGSGVDVFTQTFKNLVAGKTYTISFKVYGYGTATNNAFYVRIPKNATFSNQTGIEAGSSGKTYIARFNLNSNTGKWITASVDFVADASTALIQFQNYRSGQGFYYFDDIALSHAYDATVTDPDCVNGGYTTYTCACGATYTDNATNALGHSYVDGICGVCGAEDPNYVPPHVCNVVEQERVDATCTADGYIKYACDCGLGEYTETISAKGHTAGAAADCDSAQVCTVCGAELVAALGHDWADATCTAPKTCSVCGATEGEALGHTYDNDCDPDCNVCYENREELNHNVIHVAAKDATCTATGNIEYWYCDVCGMAWLDAECTMNTNLRAVVLPMAEHTYFDDCSAICEACGYEREVSHNVIHVAAKDATCTATGNIEYWYCDACGMAWLDEACTMNTNLRAVNLPMAEHTYFDDCSPFCEVCGYEREVSHNVIHVAAKDATCTAIGNIEYWYCDACGMAWLDAECTMNTNLRAVVLPIAEHVYADEFDVDCDNCGAIREVEMPVVSAGNSASEDVRGLATKFDINVLDLGIAADTTNVADYTNASVNGYKLITMGAIADNGVNSIEIPCVYLYDLEADSASYAVRVINIPEGKENAEITFTPYFVVEIDGVETTVYGEEVVASYAAVIG